MLTVSNFFRTSKSASPVTRCEQSESKAAARMRLSSASRQMLITETTRTGSICRSTKKVIKRACRGANPNLTRSFTAISSKISCEAAIWHWRRAVRHTRRQNPSVVKMASQTLLSRRTRTGQGENFRFGQTLFARQTVERGQHPVQFALHREKILIDALDLLVGQPLDFFNHLSCVHVSNLAAVVQEARREINIQK